MTTQFSSHTTSLSENFFPVAVVGLGPMGLALARRLAQTGWPTHAWNRTPGRGKPLVDDGGKVHTSLEDAINAAPVVLICLADYAATRAVLASVDAKSLLAGRTLVQLSTGRPSEARALATWAREAGAAYIDGAILVTPSQIGTTESALLVSGERAAFDRAKSVLTTLADQVDYVAEDSGAAAALDLAFLSHFLGGLLGFYHGARIMESEGLPVARLGAMLENVAPALGTIYAHDAGRIAEDRFTGAESTLQTCATVMALIRAQGEEQGLDNRFARFASSLLEDGLKAGWGTEDAAAVMKVLRGVSTQT